MPSPVVELNRAVAVSMAYGLAVGLEIVDNLLSEPSLKNYHLLPSVRATCWQNWIVSRRRVRNLSVLRHSQKTYASVNFSWNVRP